MLIDDIPGKYGELEPTPFLGQLKQVFPSFGSDPFENQAALGFLLAREGISNAITLGLSDQVAFDQVSDQKIMTNLPIAFDWSHNNHEGAQNSMWRRVLGTVSGLIRLLKSNFYLNDPKFGTMWERSFIYIATEFGRSRERATGSAHNLSNGSVIISPLIKGNRIYGGVSPSTGLTFGFNPLTGQPAPSRNTSEAEVDSLICQALGIDFDGRSDMSGILA